MKAWDKKRYVKEKEKMRNLFFSDPEFNEFITRIRTLRAEII